MAHIRSPGEQLQVFSFFFFGLSELPLESELDDDELFSTGLSAGLSLPLDEPEVEPEEEAFLAV